MMGDERAKRIADTIVPPSTTGAPGEPYAIKMRGLAHAFYNPLEGPDITPGNYYVSVVDGERWALLAGPFRNDHAGALALVQRAKDEAQRQDPKAVWYCYGTVRMPPDYVKPGLLNVALGLDAEVLRNYPDRAPYVEPPVGAEPDPDLPGQRFFLQVERLAPQAQPEAAAAILDRWAYQYGTWRAQNDELRFTPWSPKQFSQSGKARELAEEMAPTGYRTFYTLRQMIFTPA